MRSVRINPSVFGAAQWSMNTPLVTDAKLAGYDAGQPSITRKQHSRIGTNPNSISAQIERIHASWNAEYLGKNSPFGIGYLHIRRNYCSPLGWIPNTGDSKLDADVRAYVEEWMEDGGINCSAWEAFSRAANVELPVRGDSALVWLRDESRLRLQQVTGDQIGELYTFVRPVDPIPGLTYFAGMFFNPKGLRVGMRIYDKGTGEIYSNPQSIPESDIVYFQDNLFEGARGMTKFHGTIVSLTKADTLFQFGMDAAQKQAKTAVVVSNDAGGPLDELTYDTQTNLDGSVVVIEKTFDGAQTEYQYSGDTYQLIKTEAPGPELIAGCKYADERSCLSLGIPYSVMVSAAEHGGADVRLEIGKGAKEIQRLHKLLGRSFQRIVYMVMLDAIERKIFKGRALNKPLAKGMCKWPTLPTADAFRETQDDIASIRAGYDSYTRALGRHGENFDDIVSEKQFEAVKVAKATQDANRMLQEEVSPIDGKPYEPTVSKADIAQSVDGQQDSGIAPSPTAGGKQVTDNPPNAFFAALSNFEEEKHPRAPDGRFGDKPGDKKAAKPKGKGNNVKQSKTPAPALSEKALRAQKSAVRVDTEIQQYAEEHNEPRFAKAIGGASFRDNEPVDIVLADDDGRISTAIELKTVVKNSNGKITMKREAMERKQSWEKRNKAQIHTVILDDSEVFNAGGPGVHDESKRKIYYANGYGSFRINSMHEVKSLDELKTLLRTPYKKLPAAAQKRKKA